MADPKAELERLAAKDRRREPVSDQEPPGPSLPTDVAGRDTMVDRAFGLSSFWTSVYLGALSPLALAWSLFVTESERPSERMIALCLSPLTLIAVVLLVLNPWRRRRETAWLAGLPFGFDREAYLRELRVERDACAPTATVTFDAALDPKTRDGLLHAACGAMGGQTGAEWKGETQLVVTGAPLVTRLRRSRNFYVYSNRPAHRWLHRFVERFLVHAHALHPVRRLSVLLRSD